MFQFIKYEQKKPTSHLNVDDVWHQIKIIICFPACVQAMGRPAAYAA